MSRVGFADIAGFADVVRSNFQHRDHAVKIICEICKTHFNHYVRDGFLSAHD
jgi:hypothetical protein